MSTSKKTPAPTKLQSSSPTHVHQIEGEVHVVGLGPLKVLICHEEGSWFAQGLDLDYAASGNSLEEVKTNFRVGLIATVDLHIKMYQNLKKLLKPAPEEVWEEMYTIGKPYTYTQMSKHEDLSKSLKLLGFDSIRLFEPEALAA